MRQRRDLRIVAVNHRMQRDRLIHVGIDRWIVLQHFAVEIEGADVRRAQRAKGRPKAVHQHLVFANRHAQMSGNARAQPRAIQCPRRTANIKLHGFN